VETYNKDFSPRTKFAQAADAGVGMLGRLLLALVAGAGMIGGAGMADGSVRVAGPAAPAGASVSAVLAPAIAVGQLVPLLPHLPHLALAPNASAGAAAAAPAPASGAGAAPASPTARSKGARGRPGVRACQHDGCAQVAKFGDPAGGGPVACRAHKTPAHRSMHGWMPCLHAEGCKQKGSFGFRSGRYVPLASPMYMQRACRSRC